MESTLRRGAGAPGLRLIETLGWDGVGFHRLGLHMARLAASAQELGWRCDLPAARAALRTAVATVPARVRLTLDARGRIDVTCAAMPGAAVLWQVGLADDRLLSTDPWLTVKSTNRTAYDKARANLAPGLDEVLFQNQRGEVCDGSITTVFFDAGAGLCTPPLTSGLLPGVLRAEMLATGAAREAVLLAENLRDVRLWLGNSLRGLIEARYSETETRAAP